MVMLTLPVAALATPGRPDPRSGPADGFQLLLERGEPGQRADQRPQHAGVVLQHRGRGLWAHRDLHRHRSRLDHARPGRGARADHAQHLLDAAAGTRNDGDDRLQRLLLPLPRHEHRACALARQSSPTSTPRCCSLASSTASSTSTPPIRPRSTSARSPTRSTGASTGRSSRMPRQKGLMIQWTPGERLQHRVWKGYNEMMIMYILAMGSPTHPIPGLDRRLEHVHQRLPVADALRSDLCGLRQPSSPCSTRTAGSTSATSAMDS